MIELRFVFLLLRHAISRKQPRARGASREALKGGANEIPADFIAAEHCLRDALNTLWGNGDRRRLSRASFAVLAAKVCGVLAAFLVQLPLTRLLGAESYGTYVYVLAWVMIAGIVTGSGVDTTFVRFIPIYVADASWARLKGMIAFGFGSALSACALVSILILACFALVGGRGFLLQGYLLVALALLFLLTASNIAKAALRGLQRVLLGELMESVVRPMLTLAIFLVFYFLRPTADAATVLQANAFAVLVVLLVLSVHLWRCLPAAIRTTRATYSDWRQWLGMALPMILIAGMGLLLSRTDILMLGSLKGLTEAGIYAIGSRFAELATFGLLAVNTVLAPRISEMHHAGQHDRLQQLLSVAVLFSMLFTCGVAVVLSALGSLLLSLFGPEFPAAYVSMLILLGGQTINALAGSVGYLMIMTGRQIQAAWVLFVALLLNVGGNLVLIPPFGLNGAAGATCISTAFWNIALLVIVKRQIGLNPSILSIRTR